MAASTLQGLLGQLPQAVEAQLGRTDSLLSRDVKYHFAKFGATRLKRDGTVQVGRQDRQALEQLVSGAGDQQKAGWHARASKALDNVMKAHLERLPGAIAGTGGKGHSREIGEVAASGVMMGTTGGLVGSTDLVGKPIGEVVQEAFNRAADAVRLVVNDLNPGDVWTAPVTPAQTAAGFAALGAASGVAAYLDERSDRLGAERAVPAAWTQAHGADVRGRLEISLPDAPQSSAEAARTQAVAGMAKRLGQLTGSDSRAVLSQFAGAPTADRQRLIVQSLAPDLSPQQQNQVLGAMDRTRIQGSSRAAVHAGDVDRAVRAVLEVDAKNGGNGKFADVFPKVDPALAPRHLPEQSGDGAALSGLPPAGSARPVGQQATTARRAGGEKAQGPEGRTGPNG